MTPTGRPKRSEPHVGPPGALPCPSDLCASGHSQAGGRPSGVNKTRISLAGS